MKKRLFILFLLTLGLISCTTTENLYTSIGPNGSQINFLRPLSIETKNRQIKDLNLDLTVNTKTGSIISNPVLNYTFTKPLSSSVDVENITVGFVCGDKEILPLSKSVLFKNIVKDKFLEIRYSSEIDKDLFQDTLNSYDQWNILLIYPDGTKSVLESEEFNERILKLKIIL